MKIKKYIKKGSYFAVKSEAVFRKLYLSVNDGTGRYRMKHYGIYECFTEETQHIYGTEEELLFILGVVSELKEELNFNISAELIEKEILNEMIKIAKQEEMEIEAENSETAYDKYFNHSEKLLQVIIFIFLV